MILEAAAVLGAVLFLGSQLLMLFYFLGMAFSPGEDRWPPISDDEFMQRCTPGTSRVTALKVRRIIAEQLGVDYDRVYPEQHFVDDLGC